MTNRIPSLELGTGLDRRSNDTMSLQSYCVSLFCEFWLLLPHPYYHSIIASRPKRLGRLPQHPGTSPPSLLHAVRSSKNLPSLRF